MTARRSGIGRRILGGSAAALALLAATATVGQAATPNATGFVQLQQEFTASQVLQIHPGDWLGGGYEFQMTGAAPAQTVTFSQPTASLQVACSPVGADSIPSPGSIAGTIRIALSGGPVSTVAGATDWYPFTGGPGLYSDGIDPATYQGNVQAPDLCGGQAMYVNAEVFQANVHSTDVVDRLLIQFHVETTSAGIDCGNVLQNPAPGVAVCHGGWSGTSSQLADTPAVLATPAANPSAPGYITISGSMEGDYKFNPNDWIGGGFTFMMTGAKPAQTVQFNGATVSMPVSCASDSTKTIIGTIVISLSGGPYSTTAGSSDWYPFTGTPNTYNDGYDPATWQGDEKAPDLCSGGEMEDQTGATFEANVTSTDTTDQLMVRFHYGPHGNPGNTVDCGDPSRNTPAGYQNCGASWSSSPTVTPGPPTVPPQIPEGQPFLLAAFGLGAAVVLGWMARRSRSARAAA